MKKIKLRYLWTNCRDLLWSPGQQIFGLLHPGKPGTPPLRRPDGLTSAINWEAGFNGKPGVVICHTQTQQHIRPHPRVWRPCKAHMMSA